MSEEVVRCPPVCPAVCPSQAPLASGLLARSRFRKWQKSGLANAFPLAHSSIALWHASAHDKQSGIDDHSTTAWYSSGGLKILDGHLVMHSPQTPPKASMHTERSSSPDILQPLVYARLHHFRGKSSAAKEGKSKQVYSIDALQVVFGREESCDIRIYADNVSRKHCKITIDLLTGQVRKRGRRGIVRC